MSYTSESLNDELVDLCSWDRTGGVVATLEEDGVLLLERGPDGLRRGGHIEAADLHAVDDFDAGFAEFERATTAVLIATDCISEGLNLQYACAEIIHYELPWNPNRLEQRNGRVDRFGQREPFVGINTLVLDDDLDAALLEMIVRKAEQMRADYGFVPPFLANADILAHLSARAAAHRVQPNLFEAAAAEAGAEAARAQMTDMERRARAVIDGAGLKDTDLLDRERTDAIHQESFYGHAGVSLPMITEAGASHTGGPPRCQTPNPLPNIVVWLGSAPALRRWLRTSSTATHSLV